MSQISSINFKKSIAINTAHNDRTLAPSYLISDRGVECDRPDEQARELKEQIIAQAKETYTSRTGQRFQAKTYEWSAVCNIKPDTTMDDLKRLAQHFSDEYGFQCYQIAIHRDEGHIDEDGKEQINHHAHLEFITLDKNTGVNCFKMRDFPKSKMREIQSEVSQILQMQRGEDKRKSGRQRTEPRQYAKQKEAEKKAAKKLTKAAVKAELEKVRKSCIGRGYDKDFFRQLKALNEREYTADSLASAIDDLLNGYEKTVQTLENTLSNKENTIERQNKTIAEQEKTISDLKTEIAHNRTEMAQISTNDSQAREIYTQMIKNAPSELILSQNDSEPSFFKKIYRLYERAINTIKDQAERLAELLRLDRELREENQRLKDELKEKTKEYDEFQCELADILDIDYFDSKDLKSTIMLNVQSLKSYETTNQIKESMSATRADMSSISAQFNELFNSSDDTEQEQQQSDEEKPRTFKAKKQ